MFDNNTDTKWCCEFEESIYVEFNTPNPIAPSGYVLITGNDTGEFSNRNPISWKLLGRLNQNSDWTVLGEWNYCYEIPDEDRASAEFSIANPAQYKYYRFEVTEVGGYEDENEDEGGFRRVFQLSELQLKVPAHVPTTINLSNVTEDMTAGDGDVLTGTLGADVKISIANDATVTLDGVTINGTPRSLWAGITCEGNAPSF